MGAIEWSAVTKLGLGPMLFPRAKQFALASDDELIASARAFGLGPPRSGRLVSAPSSAAIDSGRTSRGSNGPGGEPDSAARDTAGTMPEDDRPAWLDRDEGVRGARRADETGQCEEVGPGKDDRRTEG